jgi:L-lysine 2,3-aminomutase
MIPEVTTPLHRPESATAQPRWQQELRDGYTSTQALLQHLGLDSRQIEGGLLHDRDFTLRVPASFVGRMQPGNPLDPLLLQVLPRGLEANRIAGYGVDPVGDLAASKEPGLLHKYAGRVLLITTGACAVHCRYCFRRHFPYHEAKAWQQDWEAAIAYLRADTSIHEVILSGGDPLTLSDTRLSALAQQLATIPHLRRLRIHTRLPIVLPRRIDTELLAWLSDVPLAKVVVVHANHANEIDGEVTGAIADLKTAGVTVLNQAVLLRGVNTTVDALSDLSEALFAAGVLPYYLHLLDPVQGAAQFDVAPAEAARLLDGLRAALPGYLVPRLVRERAGAKYKLPLELIYA